MTDQDENGIIRTVIYARYSSSGQREESIEGQIRECRAYAARNNLAVIGEYTDKALSGRPDRRPGFKKMIHDAERGDFDVVICWKMDRLARNRYDSAMYKHKLRKCGVKLFYAMESVPEGPEGIILESVMEGYAEYYSENLSQNVKRGNYESAKELKTLGLTLLGLRKGPDGRFEIDPDTAPIVQRIFNEYASGKPAKEIYTELNAEGFRTSRGGLFNKNSIRRIIQNERYAGVYIWQDMRVEGGIPQLVSHEIWEKCQLQSDKFHVSPAAHRDAPFLLTTKLFCGHCGAAMTGDSGRSKSGSTYHYYICNNRRAHRCDKKRAPQAWIEGLIVEKLIYLINSDEFIEEVADRCITYLKNQEDTTMLDSLEKRKKENRKALDNMLKAIEAGVITESTTARLKELEEIDKQLDEEIGKEIINKPEIEREQVVFFLQRMRHGSTNDPEYRQFLVDTFLNKAFLYDGGKLILCLNYTGENSQITLQTVESALDDKYIECSSFAPCGPPNGANTNTIIKVYLVGKVAAVVFHI
ncbi:MAG: recombinase family protein [Lachnospiraceae bacterium]|nr:recombinase family protein [Lachnospiraceae bacterium]